MLGYRGILKLNFFLVARNLSDILRKKKIRLLQTFFEDSIFVVWMATFGIKKDLVLLSSRRDMGLGVGNQPWYHKLFGLVLPLVNRRFDGIIANSYQVREYVAKREKTPREKIEVIYNGVELPVACAQAPKIFSKQPAECWIVIVASLNPVKRHDILINAISLLKNRLRKHQIRILVLGKGPLRGQLLEQVEREGVGDLFVFQGAVNNVSDFLQHCDIGVLCSDREGLSNAILEYMVCGLPVIATDVGGNRELVDETNGFRIPPGNAAALADALFELITDKNRCLELGRKSREKAERNFSWTHSMLRLEEYYQSKILENGAQ
jgi:glycosyltransferase involved in cell wall biosynthesis